MIDKSDIISFIVVMIIIFSTLFVVYYTLPKSAKEENIIEKEYKLISVSEPTKDTVLIIFDTVPKYTITFLDENNNFQFVRDETTFDNFIFIYSNESKVVKKYDKDCRNCIVEWKIYTNKIGTK